MDPKEPTCVACGGDMKWEGINCPYCERFLHQACAIGHEIKHRDAGDTFNSSSSMAETESGAPLLHFPT